MTKEELAKLKKLSANIRLDILKTLLNMGYGHLGGSLSVVEALSALYGKQLKYDSKNPKWNERDMVVMSKGHAGTAWYCALANVGFFDKQKLKDLNVGGKDFPSHPDRLKIPGVDMTTGSLGQGSSIAAGIATGFRLDKSPRYVYVIVGDGELNEGQCWEAFSYLAANKLNNCIVMIDINKRQLDGWTKDVLEPFDIVKKMEAFGFFVAKAKGNDEASISEAIDKCKACKDSAVCVALDTIKGQGVEFFENYADNHSVKFNTPDTIKACEDAIAELEKSLHGGEKNV
jgi:transketolase